MLAQYCHVVDVIRKFNPQLTVDSLKQETYIGNADLKQVRARIRAVSSDFETKTGRALRLQRAGSPGAEETYVFGDLYKRRPLKISFPDDKILPFDPEQGDAIELRVARDEYRDITADDDTWVLKSRPGQLIIYRRLIPHPFWGDEEDRVVRATYRYGSLGGDERQGGQTTLSSSVTAGETTLTVENTGRLPAYPDVLLIGNDEYVEVQDVDHQNDELTVSRGAEATTDSDHDSGAIVHYCPGAVRDAIAAKTAVELIGYDDWVDELVDADGLAAQGKVDQWESEYDAILAKHSGVRRM